MYVYMYVCGIFMYLRVCMWYMCYSTFVFVKTCTNCMYVCMYVSVLVQVHRCDGVRTGDADAGRDDVLSGVVHDELMG